MHAEIHPQVGSHEDAIYESRSGSGRRSASIGQAGLYRTYGVLLDQINYFAVLYLVGLTDELGITTSDISQ